MLNVLFICSANKDRSKTAEDYFAEKYPSINFDSAGTNQKTCFKLGTTFVDLEQLIWADLIYVMETKHAHFINKFSEREFNNKIEVLNIKDIYTYNQKELITILSYKIDFSNR